MTPTRKQLEQALSLAVNIIMTNEPGHSCAVSNEAVALAAVSCGLVDDDVMKVITDALTLCQDEGCPNHGTKHMCVTR